jgi:SH3 domain protein
MGRITGAIGLLVLLPGFAAAETAYVTDALQVGLHEAADTSDSPFRRLDIGQQLEILSQTPDNAHVELPDGTRGYVKAGFLVDEMPANLSIDEIKEERDRYARELEEAQAALAKPAATVDALTQETEELRVQLQAAATQLAQLDEENAQLRRRQAETRNSMPLQWVAGAVGACLVGGFLLGLWWVDHHSRKRHGGIRIY